MLAGLVFIVAGILIALYPPLLSLIAAAVLVFTGTVLLIVGYRYKKALRDFEDPFIDFIMKI
ncbi:MAG: hypothetical protein GF408_00115 [Candidatus Omnitrophica bacterium]|nr:hypothetical protein [Candidatus Omnitrophota bacterium]